MNIYNIIERCLKPSIISQYLINEIDKYNNQSKETDTSTNISTNYSLKNLTKNIKTLHTDCIDWEKYAQIIKSQRKPTFKHKWRRYLDYKNLLNKKVKDLRTIKKTTRQK